MKRWARAEELFAAALERPDEEREPFLVAATGDADLLGEVRSLLEAHRQAGSFLEPWEPAGPEALTAVTGPGPAWEGRRLGAWRIVREIGRGGMSRVFLAERADGEFEQRAALKLLRWGLDGAETLARFRRERQILARLDHPGIARLLDGGTTDDGVPYVVMEYVEGEALDVFCDRRRLPLHARLELFCAVCEAVSVAHRNLVVHRDLKPANVLVTAEGAPKLLDFGIAKLLFPDEQATAPASPRPMTPRYASPEQWLGEPVTTVSDVYSLGLLLYRLLAGAVPERAAPDEELPPPSAIRAPSGDGPGDRAAPDHRRPFRLAGDLEAIVLTAVRPQPARRYPSVDRLRDDLRRYLAGLPVEARGDSLAYRTAKLIRRHGAAVAVAVAAVALLAGSVVATAVQAARVSRQRDVAERERARAERVSELLVGLFDSADPEVSAHDASAREIVDRAAGRLTASLAGAPADEAAALQTLGRVYFHLGLTDRAAELLEQARDRRRADSEPLLRAETLTWLGTVRYTQDRLDEAESHYREALAIRRAVLGDTHFQVGDALTGLAKVHERRGDYSRAAAALRHALRFEPATADESRRARAEKLNTLGNVLGSAGDLPGAGAAYLGALAEVQASFGREHPHVAVLLDNLGSIAIAQGRLAQADSLFARSIEIRRRYLGDDHYALANGLHDRAVVQIDLGDLDSAEALLRRALDIRTRHLGAGHLRTANSLYSLALVVHLRGDPAAAEPLYREAQDRIERALPSRHPNRAHGLLGVGRVWTDLGRPAAAEPLLREALALRRAGLPAGHWRLAEAENALGACLLAQGRLAEAEALLVPSHARLLAARGPSVWTVRRSLASLAELERRRHGAN